MHRIANFINREVDRLNNSGGRINETLLTHNHSTKSNITDVSTDPDYSIGSHHSQYLSAASDISSLTLNSDKMNCSLRSLLAAELHDLRLTLPTLGFSIDIGDLSDISSDMSYVGPECVSDFFAQRGVNNCTDTLMDTIKALLMSVDVILNRNMSQFAKAEKVKTDLYEIRNNFDETFEELVGTQRKLYRDTIRLNLVQKKISKIYHVAKENMDKCGFYAWR